ncbi:MAG: alpha/beta hydrolase, partial [Actinomycetota bacterium]
MPEAERKALIDRYPVEIGHLVGVPVDARDRANRLALSRRIKLLESKKRERDELLKGFPEARSLLDHRTWLSKMSPKLAGYYEGFIGLTPLRRRMTALSREIAAAKNLQRQLEEIAERSGYPLVSSDVYLLEFDTHAAYGDGHAVVALGKPNLAEHVGIIVPGINNSLLDVQNPLRDAADLRLTVFLNEGKQVFDRTATVMWLGYDAPNGLFDAANQAEAAEGAPRLVKFVDGLRSAHFRTPIRPGYSARSMRDPHIAGFVHSYGSTVGGRATKTGMDIDDLALLGSPGGGAKYGSELASRNR